MSAAPKEQGQDVAHELMSSPSITITQAGYVNIYLSNEETTPVEVYFDDFKVTHTKSPVVQMDDYYPFGLTFNSFQRENSAINRWRFQGQEHVDDLGLGWDSFKWRNHQPEIGRFFNIDPLAESFLFNSPYAFSENKVTAHIELEGLEAVPFSSEIEGHGLTRVENINRSGKSINHSTTIVKGDRAVAGTSVSIKLGENVTQSSVSDQSVGVISTLANSAGESNIQINSASRTPAGQARVMYDKLGTEGVESMKALYGKSGDQVIDVYANSMNRPEGNINVTDQTVQAMTDKILEVGPQKVSKHTSDPASVQVFDLSTKPIKNHDNFSNSIIEHTGKGKFLSGSILPGGSEKAYHIEIPQKKKQ
jgi:RHS repeat-associated protein